MFDLAQSMCRKQKDFCNAFGVAVREHSIHQAGSMSRLMPISSDAKTLDGINVHFAVLDEIASHRNKAV